MEKLTKIITTESANVRMTEADKASVKARLFSKISAHKESASEPSVVISPIQPTIKMSWIRSVHTVPSFVIMCMLLITSAVSASERALPGNPLHALKMQVEEFERSLLVQTPAEKVLWEKDRLESRLVEIEKLGAKKKISATTAAKIGKNIEDQSNKVVVAVAEAKQAGENDIAGDVQKEVEVTLRVYGQVLTAMAQEDTNIDAIVEAVENKENLVAIQNNVDHGKEIEEVLKEADDIDQSGSKETTDASDDVVMKKIQQLEVQLASARGTLASQQRTIRPDAYIAGSEQVVLVESLLQEAKSLSAAGGAADVVDNEKVEDPRIRTLGLIEDASTGLQVVDKILQVAENTPLDDSQIPLFVSEDSSDVESVVVEEEVGEEESVEETVDAEVVEDTVDSPEDEVEIQENVAEEVQADEQETAEDTAEVAEELISEEESTPEDITESDVVEESDAVVE